jgi:hypothetical protein
MTSTPAPHYHAVDERSTSTLFFAPEIESGLIGLVWREPDRLGTLKRELDPALHFLQPHCRWLLEAIDLAYRELGTADFACVIQVLRELSRLEDVGGLEGANEIYKMAEFVDSPAWNQKLSDRLFTHHLESLKTYAINRQEQPPRSTYLFRSGKATLVPNKVKRSQNSADFIGEAWICGRWYVVGASLALDGSFLNFRFEPKL